MGVIAWIILGWVAGLVAILVVPPTRRRGLIMTCLVGAAGASLGGWAAAMLFHLHHVVRGFFDAATWIPAVAGAALLLVVYHLVTGGSGRSRRSGRFALR